MNTQYISESLSPSEVFRQFGDQVPEFMQTWLEGIVNKAQDAEDIYGLIYQNTNIDLDSPTLAKDLDTWETQSAAYDDLKEEMAGHKEEVSTLEFIIKELKQENKEYMKLLNDNGIDY